VEEHRLYVEAEADIHPEVALDIHLEAVGSLAVAVGSPEVEAGNRLEVADSLAVAVRIHPPVPEEVYTHHQWAEWASPLYREFHSPRQRRLVELTPNRSTFL
jgi:hypothetical protein